MPFGITNAPSVFQHLINKVLKSLIDSGNIVVYLYDIIMATKTFEEHVEILTDVLRLLKAAG